MIEISDLTATVLLVDDDEDFLDVLSTALLDAGYNCIRASNARGALKLIDRTPEIDVVVSDIRMPGMDGIELIRGMRERYPDRAWLQVIFVTGHGSLDNVTDALRLAAVDFLAKPVQGLVFLNAVKKACERAQVLRSETNWRERSESHLGRLLDEVEKLGAVLRSSINKNGDTNDKCHNTRRTGRKLVQPVRERLLELLRIRDVRTQFFPGKLFIDPAWHMLMELMENHLEQRQVTAFSLFMVSGVPTATASRRLEDLTEAGLVERWVDPADGRRQLVSLTPVSTELMLSYLTALDQQLSPEKP